MGHSMRETDGMDTIKSEQPPLMGHSMRETDGMDTIAWIQYFFSILRAPATDVRVSTVSVGGVAGTQML